MKTAILTIALALATALSALAQTVMRENSTVYFKTNVYLHDDPTNALHTRISVEGKEPLWVAASNEVAYYQSSAMTNASIHAKAFIGSNVVLYGSATIDGNNIITNEADPIFVGSAAYSITTNMTTNWNRLLDIYSVNSGIGVYRFIGGNVEYGPQSMYQTSTNELSDIATYYSAEVGYEEVNDTFALFSFRGQWPTLYWEWRGRINDTEASRIKAIPTNTIILTQTARLYSDGTNLFFASTVPPGFTNALTTNAP